MSLYQVFSSGGRGVEDAACSGDAVEGGCERVSDGGLLTAWYSLASTESIIITTTDSKLQHETQG